MKEEIEVYNLENCKLGKVKSFKVRRCGDNFDNPVIFRDCTFSDDVSVEIIFHSNNPVEINNVTMGKNSTLSIEVKENCTIDGLTMGERSTFTTGEYYTIDELSLNNLTLGKSATLTLSSENKNIPELSLTNCRVRDWSIWEIVDEFDKKINREIQGQVSGYKGFRIIGAK